MNENLGNIGRGEYCSLCKSENPEGREIPAHPWNLNGPQPLLFGTGQAFNFHVGELGVVEVVLDSFHHALRPVEGETNRLDFL